MLLSHSFWIFCFTLCANEQGAASVGVAWAAEDKAVTAPVHSIPSPAYTLYTVCYLLHFTPSATCTLDTVCCMLLAVCFVPHALFLLLLSTILCLVSIVIPDYRWKPPVVSLNLPPVVSKYAEPTDLTDPTGPTSPTILPYLLIPRTQLAY